MTEHNKRIVLELPRKLIVDVDDVLNQSKLMTASRIYESREELINIAIQHLVSHEQKIIKGKLGIILQEVEESEHDEKTERYLKLCGLLPSKIFCVNCHEEMPEATEKSTREGKYVVTCQNCGSENIMCTMLGLVTGEENFDDTMLEKRCSRCKLSCENKE
jgi:hypothetical protein